MAFIQQSIPSPNKIFAFSLKDYSGGLNNASDQLKDNEASKLLNMSFCDETLMERRLGQTYFDELVLYDNAEIPLVDEVLFIDEYKPYTGDNVLIRATDLKLYFNDTKIADLTGEIDGVNFRGKYIFTNNNSMYVYGIFPQETSTYEKVTGTAVVTPVIMKIVNPTTGFVPLTTEHVKGITAYNYTTLEVSYEPCANEIADTYNGANVVPTNIRYLISRDGRLYASGDNADDDNIFITDVHNPYYFPVSLPLQIPPDSDKVVGMAIFDDCTVIGRNNDVYVISGNTNNPTLGTEVFMLKKLNTHTGFANNKAISNVNNYLFFLGSDGVVYALSSVNYKNLSYVTTIISKQLDITKAPIGVTLDDARTASAIYFEEEWILSIKDKILVYSYKNQSWTMYSDFNARSFYNLNDVLIWGNKDGRTVKYGTTYMDFGLPYPSYWYSKRFDMGNANNYKQFREFFLVAHVYNDIKSTINISFEVDYADVSGTLVVDDTISVWGTAVWGDRFINRNIVESLPMVIGRRGRNIRFKFSNGYYIQDECATVDDLIDVLAKKEGLLVKVIDTGDLYLYTNREWKKLEEKDLNQRMKIYQVNGDYELRGKR